MAIPRKKSNVEVKTNKGHSYQYVHAAEGKDATLQPMYRLVLNSYIWPMGGEERGKKEDFPF
jgi:hypothetical protein